MHRKKWRAVWTFVATSNKFSFLVFFMMCTENFTRMYYFVGMFCSLIAFSLLNCCSFVFCRCNQQLCCCFDCTPHVCKTVVVVFFPFLNDMEVCNMFAVHFLLLLFCQMSRNFAWENLNLNIHNRKKIFFSNVQ